MARKKVSKAAHIRQTLETLGKDAAPKDVIATLAAKRIKVSAAQVSNIKTVLAGGSKAPRGRNGTNGIISLSDLLAAKKLVREVGLEKAQVALATLAKLAT